MHQSDPQLVQACQAGRQDAWNALVERYGRLVYSIPRRYGLSESDADDVFAAVWATVFRKLGELRDQLRLSSWLITTTHRECWRIGRRNAAYKGSDFESHFADVGSPADDKVEAWETQHLVREGLKELGGRCQELLTALFFDAARQDYEAVSAKLGVPIGSIGPTRARCFKKLAAILRDMGLEPDLSEAAGKPD